MKRKTLEKLVNHAAGDPEKPKAPKLTYAQRHKIHHLRLGYSYGSITNSSMCALEKIFLVRWESRRRKRPNGQGFYTDGKWVLTDEGKAYAATLPEFM